VLAARARRSASAGAQTPADDRLTSRVEGHAPQTPDEIAIRQVVEHYVVGWREADGARLKEVFDRRDA
jgi:hypothetical protein